MTDINKQLADLEELRRNGSITEQEYQRDRARIYSNANPLGMAENSYLLLMHLSQLAGFLFFGLGFAIPIVMWAVNKDKSVEVDRHGKNILNFIISWMIYYTVSAILMFVLVGIPMLIVLCLLNFIFIIIAAIKANDNEFWKYPLTIPFFKID